MTTKLYRPVARREQPDVAALSQVWLALYQVCHSTIPELPTVAPGGAIATRSEEQTPVSRSVMSGSGVGRGEGQQHAAGSGASIRVVADGTGGASPRLVDGVQALVDSLPREGIQLGPDQAAILTVVAHAEGDGLVLWVEGGDLKAGRGALALCLDDNEWRHHRHRRLVYRPKGQEHRSLQAVAALCVVAEKAVGLIEAVLVGAVLAAALHVEPRELVDILLGVGAAVQPVATSKVCHVRGIGFFLVPVLDLNLTLQVQVVTDCRVAVAGLAAAGGAVYTIDRLEALVIVDGLQGDVGIVVVHVWLDVVLVGSASVEAVYLLPGGAGLV
eukprot:scaffold100833_cov41-Prasinocladus_malaysianus.AAC.1